MRELPKEKNGKKVVRAVAVLVLEDGSVLVDRGSVPSTIAYGDLSSGIKALGDAMLLSSLIRAFSGMASVAEEERIRQELARRNTPGIGV